MRTQDPAPERPAVDTPEDGPQAAPEPAAPAQSEPGVSYGYGHPAHRPDPAATYSFKPNLIRPLPVNPKQRWR